LVIVLLLGTVWEEGFSMRRTFLGVLATAAALWPALVSSYAPTDSIMDAVSMPEYPA
jgi:hypothetical protein